MVNQPSKLEANLDANHVVLWVWNCPVRHQLDPYFNNHIFDLWWDVFQDPQVTIREVRLLTAKELTQPQDGKKPQLNLKRFELIRSELMSRGIRLEIRLSDRRDLPNDRLLYSPGQAINMPPFAGVYGDHRHVSEYTRSSTTRDLFIEYWEKAFEVGK